MCKRIWACVKALNLFGCANALICLTNIMLGYEFYQYMDITLYVFWGTLAFVSGQWVGNHLSEIRQSRISICWKVVFFFLCFYTAFALVGNACFVYPLTMQMNIKRCVCYLLTTVWVAPMVAMFCYKLANCKVLPMHKQKLPLKVVAVCTIIMAGVFALYVIAFNPCVGTYDTVYTMTLAVTDGVQGMQDYQPPFYVLWLETILKIWETPYAVVIVQFIFFVYVFWKAVFLFWEKGLSEKGVYVCTMFVTLSVNIQLFLVTVWKDIPYCLALVWLIVILAYLQSNYDQWYLYIELVFALVCVFFFRQNGVVPYVLTCLVLPFVIRKGRVWISVLVALVMVIFIKGPVYESLDIQRDNGGMTYVGLGLDIAGVYYNGGTISQDAMEFVVQMTNNVDEYEYTPYELKNISTEISMSMGEFIPMYIEAFFHNPKLILRGILCRSDGIWGLYNGINAQVSGASIVGPSETADASWLQFFPARKGNCLTEKMIWVVGYVIWKGVTRMFMGRVGVWTLLLLGATCVMMYNKQYKYLIVLIPCVGQIISLVLAMGWPCYRYMIPIEFMSIFVLMLVWLLGAKKEEEINDAGL